jgi:hypothetical protein
VTQAERQVHDGLAGALSDRDVATIVRGLRKLVDGRPAGHAIARRRGG